MALPTIHDKLAASDHFRIGDYREVKDEMGVYRDQSGAITSGLPVIRPESAESAMELPIFYNGTSRPAGISSVRLACHAIASDAWQLVLFLGSLGGPGGSA